MADITERDPLPSSSENINTGSDDPKEEMEPTAKRRKLSKCDTMPSDKLEHRLGGILCCAVCLDLPRAAVYQCGNGHLMCAGCFTHLLADARLRDETATCPNCRVEISKTSASRNLAVEKAISELPSECQFCAKEFPRHALEYHEDSKCDNSERKSNQIVVNSKGSKQCASFVSVLFQVATSFFYLATNLLRRRPGPSTHAEWKRKMNKRRYIYKELSGCKYACIGCPWQGPYHGVQAHESACTHPSKTGAEVMEVLQAKEKIRQEECALYNHVFELLSYEKITFNDLQLKPYRTEEYVNKLYYETSRFSAFNHQWVVKAHINQSQRDPTQCSERDITYQLILKSKSVCRMSIQYVALRGPYGEAHMSPRMHAYTFGGDDAISEAVPVLLPLGDSRETNSLLSNKAINFRLIMFLTSK